VRVRMVDLRAQNREIHDDISGELALVHERSAYVGGAQVTAFEQSFADYLGVRRVIAVNSGTDAIRLALEAAGVGPGDAVLTTPLTFIATVEGIVQCGARPLFADIDPATGNISADAARSVLKAARERTGFKARAILPVHLYGLPAPMEQLSRLAQDYGVTLIEDACQAHGARLRFGGRWMRAGAVSAAGCFSFYPGKNLGAWGDGGAVAIDDETLATRVAQLRDHGRVSHYEHRVCGYNSRLDTIQAVVLSAKLKRLDTWNRRRREIAEWYRTMLSGCEVEILAESEGAESCYHLFVIRSPKRDEIKRALLREQIECGIHYPIPLHLQPACRFLGHQAGDFPAAEEFAKTILSLPMHPHLTEEEVAEVARVVRLATEGS
jgi:dTDP-4-amino-4,6-dideoxygalactose transaminase